MNIHEYQAKTMFKEYGVSVQQGFHCTSVDQALSAYDSLGSKIVAVKSQIHAGGRGKGDLFSTESGDLVMNGGVKIASSRDEVLDFSSNILGRKLVTKQTGQSGKIVNNLYVEAGCRIAHEYYLALLVDREKDSLLVMASTEGGVDIEEIAEISPEAIHKVWFDPSEGIDSDSAEALASSLGLEDSSQLSFIEMIRNLATMFVEKDCSMIEINPLVRTEDNLMVALDAKVSLDENASFRQQWIEDFRDLSEESDVEVRAKEYDLSYVDLDGNIGCLVNGAGLAMATMDVIKLYGGEPANFLDIGGGADSKSITAAFSIILEDPRLEGILVNIFGGIIRCDMVARSIIEASEETGLSIPLVVRFSGTNHEEGRQVLEESELNVITVSTLGDAGEAIVNAMGGNSQ
ncbi:MAG: ADP-forming succinate--CoA ligase subunit beta [Euryarchaeota archaeon]|nr:ADP-forming succinate--CoA ligase subunit beta [Euryarchaeota archaeon]OUW22706.1 MAG: succinate--CoA ligase subunit beta [Euryarchaeota archaeon TMED173]|tara:strand:+ start:1737 stop:2948 length:1212 start_codon:yes stop_codon:yes gene_type:complete